MRGGGTKILKGGGQAGSRCGCFKKGGGGAGTPLRTMGCILVLYTHLITWLLMFHVLSSCISNMRTLKAISNQIKSVANTELWACK